MSKIDELQARARGRGADAKAARKALIRGYSLINSQGKKRDDPEAREQKAYLAELKWKWPVVWSYTFSVPNERSLKGEGGRMKGLGAKSGIPDLLCILPSPSGRWPGLALEFKAPGRERQLRGGRTLLQVEWGGRFVMSGWCYAVVYSADEALTVVKDYMMVEVSDEAE